MRDVNDRSKWYSSGNQDRPQVDDLGMILLIPPHSRTLEYRPLFGKVFRVNSTRSILSIHSGSQVGSEVFDARVQSTTSSLLSRSHSFPCCFFLTYKLPPIM